jgi:hypothetical protein
VTPLVWWKIAGLWLHSQQSVLILVCVALTRLFFDILRTAAAGTSQAGMGRARTVSRRGAARKAATKGSPRRTRRARRKNVLLVFNQNFVSFVLFVVKKSSQK